MQTKSVTIKKVNTLIYTDLCVQEITIANSIIELKNYIIQPQTPYLINIAHNELITLLDVTDVIPYEIWYLNNELKLIGKSFSLHSESGSFRMQTQAKKLLLINQQSKEYINNVSPDFK